MKAPPLLKKFVKNCYHLKVHNLTSQNWCKIVDNFLKKELKFDYKNNFLKNTLNSRYNFTRKH